MEKFCFGGTVAKGQKKLRPQRTFKDMLCSEGELLQRWKERSKKSSATLEMRAGEDHRQMMSRQRSRNKGKKKPLGLKKIRDGTR